MPKLAPTFSEIFDYKAYEEDTVGGSMVEDEKPGDRPSFDTFMDLNFDLPLHDVQNLAPHDDVTAVGGSDIQGPLRILRHLFHGDEENMPTSSVATLRRQSTELVLDLSFPMAGSSRTTSQQRIARDLERMTSIFGSEFDTSDAVFYGGTERSESSFSYHEEEEDEQFPFEGPCDSDVAMDCDNSDASQQDGDTDLDCESQGSGDGGSESDEVQSDDEVFRPQPEVWDYDELAEEVPEDSSTPAPLERSPSRSSSSLGLSSFPSSSSPSSSSFPSSLPSLSSTPPLPSLRRSSRVRVATRPFSSSSPNKSKGKGKAVSAEPRSPTSSSRTAPKRTRSPSPDPDSDSEDDSDFPSGSRRRKRPRRSYSAVQAMLVPREDGTTAVPCAVAGCTFVCSRNDLHGLDNHFRAHYSGAEKKQGVHVQCRWGKCEHNHTFTGLLRHLKQDHLEARFACPDCGKPLSRPDAVTRHQSGPGVCKGKADARAQKKGKGKRK